MKPGEQDTLYLRFRKKVLLGRRRTICLRDVARIIADPALEAELLELPLHTPGEKEGNLLLIDMLRVVQAVKSRYPNLAVEYFGAPQTIVEISSRQDREPNLALVVLVWLLLFFGSGLAIMNFHADVSMLEVQRRIYQLVTGRTESRPLILQIPYSFGIGVGMVLFFNHIFKKKFNEEPSPLEVEMFLYEENVNQYVVAEEYRKMARESGSERP